MAIEFADSHGHLTMVFDGGEMKGAPRAPRATEVKELLARARDAGVTRILVPATDREDQRRAVETAEAHDGVYAAVGFHPHEAKDFDEDRDLRIFEELCASKKVVAVGEIGLDYHYDHSPREVQQDAFEVQVALATAHDLPLVIHTRNAWTDTFAILDRVGVPRRTIFHCFTGGPTEAADCLERGAYLSYSGIVTFPSAADTQAAAVLTPADRLLIETDSPYLAPIPHRGQSNRPAWVSAVGAFVAALRGEEPEAIAASTWAATATAFGLQG